MTAVPVRVTAILLRLAGVLLLLTAIALALSRAPDRPVQTLVARWAPPPSQFIEMNGQLVHLRDEGPRGDPLPILLLHGTASSLHTWEGWVRALRGRHRVVTVDLPGFGLTGPWRGDYPADDYRLAAYVRFVRDLLDRLAIDRVVLGGNSLGGEIAWRTAVAAPDRVAALVLVDSAGPAFVPESVPLGFRIARVPGLAWLTRWVLPRELVTQSVTSVYGDPERVTPELVDRYFELTLREGNRRALAQRMQQMTLGDATEQLATLSLPTLILWGGRDRLIPPSVGVDLQRAIDGSLLVVFPGLGHVPHEEDPVRSVAPVQGFLAACCPTPAAPVEE